jgi:hypothetical protein
MVICLYLSLCYLLPLLKASMFCTDVALERETEGDLLLADMGQVQCAGV